jgi:restriction endonuclease Mrr
MFAMSDQKPKRDYSAHQQKIIKRYYDNMDTIASQRLAELVGELYLASGKKKEKAWQSAAAAMEKLGVPKSRIDHLLKEQKPELVAELVKELQTKR